MVGIRCNLYVPWLHLQIIWLLHYVISWILEVKRNSTCLKFKHVDATVNIVNNIPSRWHLSLEAHNCCLQGLVKLADFGVATKLTEADVNTHSVVGTPYWMAPEVLGVHKLISLWCVLVPYGKFMLKFYMKLITNSFTKFLHVLWINYMNWLLVLQAHMSI